jgi:hypothetical protein
MEVSPLVNQEPPAFWGVMKMHTRAMPNNAINAEGQRGRFALLLAAGYGER